ncbi:MAG: 6-phosphofructokinase [Alphaproteobacteria bacterium]|nr:6-phosphofructokinase [Alphaproteobacteria bacterium]HCQ71018.1 6-phosphofructokinase [Rhodospirillaceae bacterium]|tara:strand:+ start:21939 stop:23018 length:1080 start_codon:yes stop_codon:yes gene_type:complete
MKKTIAVLTSGGDCAGLNAVMRAVVFHATSLGWTVLGIQNGTAGLLEEPYAVRELKREDFDGFTMRRGGTVLGTTNSRDPFHYPMPDGTYKDRSMEICDALKSLDVEALIGIGGDGSFDILSRLTSQGGIKFIGVPKTIDNDVGLTDLAVGFDTAVEVATEALDRLQPTAASHDRVMILEVMGRDAGHIALSAGIAGGADVILIPEIPYSIDAIAEKIKGIKEAGRNFALVVVSEAVTALDGEKREVVYHGGEKRYGGIAEYLAPMIAEATGFETRATVLGHVQRGGSPNHNDRLLAQNLGVHAVDLIAKGRYNRMVGWQNRGVTDVAIEDAVKVCRTVDLNGTRVHTARALGICLGDK